MLAFQLVTYKRYEFKGHIAIHCYICYMNKSEEEGVFATFRFAWVTMEGADHSCPALELTRVRTALYTQSLHFWRQAPLHILHSEFLTNCNRVREKKTVCIKPAAVGSQRQWEPGHVNSIAVSAWASTLNTVRYSMNVINLYLQAYFRGPLLVRGSAPEEHDCHFELQTLELHPER